MVHPDDIDLLQPYQSAFNYYVPKTYKIEEIKDLFLIKDTKTQALRLRICMDLTSQLSKEWFDPKLCWVDSCYSNSRFRCPRCFNLLCSKLCQKLHIPDCPVPVNSKSV